MCWRYDLRLTIQGRLPGYNELNSGHWAKRNRIKQEGMNLVGWELTQQKIQPIPGKAVVTIVCYEPTKKRDPSNVRAGAEKIILDALQNFGIIQNDNWAMLKDVPTKVLLDRQHPRIEIVIAQTTL